MNQCKVCGAEIHPRRVALGYKDSCVNHSSTQKYSGNVVADAKATTWIDIVRDPEQARHIEHLSRTRGKV